MAQHNIVFLIDVNGIPRDPTLSNTTNREEHGTTGNLHNESMELFPFPDKGDSERISNTSSTEHLRWLRDFILVTLFKEASNGTEYDFSKVQWTFKFFDSSHHVDYRDGRSFMPFDNDSFKNFETQLGLRMKPSLNVTNTDVYSRYDSSSLKFLSDAIKIITGSLPWSDAPQANFSKSFNDDEVITKNTVFAFFRVPRTESQLQDFTNLQSNSSTKDFMGVLLPSAFSSTFHHKLKIQLNFVDVWGVPENMTQCLIPNWDKNYPRQIVKCLQYLDNGKIISVPFSEYTNLQSSCMGFGLVPYITHLRTFLQQASGQNENVPSHLQKLVPVAAKNSQKISPDFDTASVSRSLKSGPSLLEASYNSQNKVLRPFRMSSGYEDDSMEYYRHKMPHERLREGERKRKRYDYGSEDYYVQHDRRRYSGFDDVESDSVEVDSQCEREQRLENWVNNDGVFSAKRKKHLDTTTTTVPMSRPAMNKSFHVFHEPAPKLPGSRGKKMLATVERRKLRVHAAVESKRRSSGEGLMDMKRITQKQEKELSAIKRRLKTFLEGELEGEEGDPVPWMKKFKKELRSFADMILEEEQPCLVALAQALVNYASVKFTQTRISHIREIYRNQSITAKDLLEQLLIVEFTALNRKIISAHELPRDKSSTNAHKMQKILTFRETELQIILRLEIAWCFFIESDEDAVDDLLMEIVRLLQIIGAYRTEPPVEYFVNTVLLPTYSQINKFMRGLYKKMNIPLPPQLAIDGSPVPSSSRRDDDSSMISSTSSANLYPEDSASQLHLHKRSRNSPSNKRPIAHRPTKKPNSGSKKVKKHIMVATSNPKLPVSHFMLDRPDLQKKTITSNTKVSPKRVRRNLFDVQKKDKKDSKTLLTLSSSSSRLKSPAFKSPKGTSSRSPSGFFRAARSKRQLVMGMGSQAGDRQFGSPTINSDVLCPESPATPGGDRLSVASKYAHTTASSGSTEKPRVILESPEIQKTDFENRPMGRVASLSFYSSGSNAPRSRAWEKSETQLMAARIKESVDLRSKELTLSDLELLPRSPDEKSKRVSDSTTTTNTPRTSLSYCADSLTERIGSPLPTTSTSLFQHIPGPAPDLDNPNIEALINSGRFPMFSSNTEIPLPVRQTEPGDSPSLPTTSNLSNLQTPSKRVQFNLNENLVNTPSSAKRTSTGTPKSILKETHDA